ncbi:MAG: ubiquinone/menaquinone biosynthesis C-methylase UbiE [Bacillariaceae sp.]|jgi:ubiquinone/menaquinone biosynthesis C-methylase UbiE
MSDVKEYEYFDMEWDAQHSSSYPSKLSNQSTLSAALNIDHQNDDSVEIRTQTQQQQRPILMLGCGNSRMGEEMIEQGGFKGPIMQVDVSRSVVENMRQRCSDLVSKGSMSFVQVGYLKKKCLWIENLIRNESNFSSIEYTLFIYILYIYFLSFCQDDATELSAFRNNMIDACLDKGLMDAIFCAEDYHQLNQIQQTIHRVLRPGGSFVFFSFSRPEFLIPKLMMLDEPSVHIDDFQKRIPWTNIEVQQLPKILLYKMQKANDNANENKQLITRSKTNRKQMKRR